MSIKFTHILLLLGSIVFQTAIVFAQVNTSIQQTALQTLQLNHKKLGFAASDIESPVITDSYTSAGEKVSHVYIGQTYAGIEVQGAVANFNIAPNGQVFSWYQSFVKNIAAKINTTKPKITREAAIKTAALAMGLPKPSNLKLLKKQPLPNQYALYNTGDISQENIPVKLMYFIPEGSEKAFLSWNLNINPATGGNWLDLWIDAIDGSLLGTISWTKNCQFEEPTIIGAHPEKTLSGNALHNHHSNCEHSFTPSAQLLSSYVAPNDYKVYAVPTESPNHGGRTTVNAPWTSATNASPYGWHDTNGSSGAEYTITRGNNVLAQEDQNGNNGTGYSPNSPTLDFNYTINLSNQPSTYVDASLTNLFYWNNIMHDIMWQYGFTAAAGNFQENNYGTGGAGSDYVLADGQDGSGTNNANFSTPVDGSKPRMQMYLWTSSNTPYLIVNSPSSVQGSYTAVPAAFGPALPNWPSGITANVVIAQDNASPFSDACSGLTNGSSISGKIALVDRGNCNFNQKVLNCQAAGAVAVIVCNNVSGAPIQMGGSGAGITIPSVMIGKANCDVLRVYCPNLNATLSNTGTPPNLDCSLDNGIICHEYGHGVSTRLTGGPNNVNCLNNQEQMGEGWSDYFGIALTMKTGDTGPKVRGMATYANSEPIDGNGIRPAPYSTDFSINDYTYSDLCDGNITVPHGVGFIWCTMLWEMTWDLIGKHGFSTDFYNANGTAGNQIAMRLIVEALKLQPCSPGFVDGRDAIILADQIYYGGANSCTIWGAFAKRGLGYGASQGSSGSRCDGTASFITPSTCSLSIEKTADFIDEVESGKTITYSLTVSNIRPVPANNVIVRDTIPAELNYETNSLSCPGTVTGQVIVINLGTLNANEVKTCTYKAKLPINKYSTVYFTDDLELGSDNWITTAGTGSTNWEYINSNAYSPTHCFYAANASAATDQYLRSKNKYTIAGTKPMLIFRHKYNTEAGWDGGVVEISANGTNWGDIGIEAIKNGYNDVIGNNPASAISNRPAFSGNSDGYIWTMIDLADYVGQTMYFRFRFATDGAQGGDGWYVDNIEIIDGLLLHNTACVSDQSGGNDCSSYDLLAYPNPCLAEAGNIIIPSGSTLPLEICQYSDLGVFSHNYSPVQFPPPANYKYAYILTNDNAPIYSIIDYGLLTNADFDFSNLPAGSYRIWGFSYNPDFGAKIPLNTYIQAKPSVQQIQNDITLSGQVCGHLTNQDEEGNPIIVTITNNAIVVQIKTNLQGAYNTNSNLMRTDLNNAGLLPLTHPYSNVPWNYTGTEAVTSFAPDIVDWVLVEVRRAADTSIIERHAALLRNDGTVVDADGITNGIRFYNFACNTPYFIVVRHRNHIDIISSQAVILPNTTPLNFTDPNSVLQGALQLVAVGNTYAMRAGDGDGNGNITIADFNIYNSQSSAINKYYQGDFNMDKNVTITDFNLYSPNASHIGVKAIRY